MVEPISCIDCRRRKIKCNRRTPCDQCTLRRAGNNCKYPVALRKRRAPSSDSSEEIETLRSRLDELESMLASIQKEQPAQDHNPLPEGLTKYLDRSSVASMLQPLRDSLETFENSINYIYEEYDTPNALLLPRIFENEEKETDFIAHLIGNFFEFNDHPFVSKSEVYELVRGMQNLNQDGLLLLNILATSGRCLPVDDSFLVEAGLTADEVSQRFMDSYINQRNLITKESLSTVQAYILACHHHMSFENVESGWKSMVSGVGAAIAVGLHVVDPSQNSLAHNRRTEIWAAINKLESTVCATMGRPNLITTSGLKSDSPDLKIINDVSALCRQINIETMSSTPMTYRNVLALDAAIDDEAAKLETFIIADKPHTEAGIVELYAVQAKLHQPHFSTHPQSEKKLVYALSKFLYHLSNIIAAVGKGLTQRLPLLQCRFMQVLVILYTYVHGEGALLDMAFVKHSLASIVTIGGVWRENVETMAQMIVSHRTNHSDIELEVDSFVDLLQPSIRTNQTQEQQDYLSIMNMISSKMLSD